MPDDAVIDVPRNSRKRGKRTRDDTLREESSEERALQELNESLRKATEKPPGKESSEEERTERELRELNESQRKIAEEPPGKESSELRGLNESQRKIAEEPTDEESSEEEYSPDSLLAELQEYGEKCVKEYLDVLADSLEKDGFVLVERDGGCFVVKRKGEESPPKFPLEDSRDISQVKERIPKPVVLPEASSSSCSKIDVKDDDYIEAFDDIPDNPVKEYRQLNTGFVSEIPDFQEIEDKLKAMCYQALEVYNGKSSTEEHYKFVKIIKVNYMLAAGDVYFITFSAEQPSVANVKEFQTQVFHAVPFTKDPEVLFCRPKPPSRNPTSVNGS